MGLFRRKKKEEPEPPAEPQIDENANWHVYADRGFEKARDQNLLEGVKMWCEAVDRFDDDTPKYLLKLHDDIFDLVSKQMLDTALLEKILPTQLVSEVDAEARIKHGEIWNPICDEIFYYAKENVSTCEGPGSAAMLFIAGAYSIIGYLRFSSDPVDSAEKCREVSKLGNLTADQCLSYGRIGYKGALKPKTARRFCLEIVSFFDRVAEALEEATSKLSEEELEQIRTNRNLDRVDRMEHLATALRIVLGASVEGRLPKRKKGDALGNELSLYISEFFKTQ